MAKKTARSSDAPEPVDTIDDPAVEARWQALVQEVIDAKAAALEARDACVAAERERGPIPSATPAAVARVKAAHDAYRAAGERVEAAARRMKAGEL